VAIRVAIQHLTRYRYARPASLGPQIVRLRPAPHNRTPLHSYSLAVQPADHFLNWQQDAYGNFLARLVFHSPTPMFEVRVDLVADLESFSPFDFFIEESAGTFPFAYGARERRELAPFLVEPPSSPRFDAFVHSLDPATHRNQVTLDYLLDANRAVYEAMNYVVRMEPGVQTPEQTLETKSGSCRDLAWLLIAALRKLGLAARFVSGYLVQLKADQEPVDAPPGPQADFTDLHAWCECFVPGAGWIGLDPTSGLVAAEGHIPLACTPDPTSAAPIEGSVEDVEVEFEFDMKVDRIIDRPRSTKPYSESKWQAVLALGEATDAALAAGDVRLTCGGEPTFVDSRDPDAPEWNIAALGGSKASKADRLIHRLKDLWAPGGVIHHGQGKWYPGEQLPRWAYACYWRRDGLPMWRDPARLARPGDDHSATSDDAKRFAEALIERLGIPGDGLTAAYEDSWYYLWRERRLPINVDPFDSRLEDPLERARLARVFRSGLTAVVGWVLPLEYEDAWVTGPLFLRDERCYLIPGDSPMGFRLPLDSLPWLAPGDREPDFPEDPFVTRSPLPGHYDFPRPPVPPATGPTLQRRRAWPAGADTAGGAPPADAGVGFGAATAADPRVRPAHNESALATLRGALCVEVREGRIHVFLPPFTRLEPFVELMAALEDCCHSEDLAVQIEGYPPPPDPRLREFKVTPDPGVIEVNVPPTSSFAESVTQTEELYEAARREHLIAEKFEIDGAHIGSGGGNHVVLGGSTPDDSPFLRRPDLLGSLLRYWHNHPALSFLFASRFIGPTSQAPRIDEARDDSVYELEIALDQLPRPGESCPPWHVDRVLRDLLVDVTGNAHRTHFSIDKLYSPHGPAGRQGLVELRAFEMPPHARMSLVQQLLVRALLRSFWETPYERPLIKWRTALHDRFMLPFYCESDLADVLGELRTWGSDFDPSWFEPHFEFRFPFLGELCLDDMRLELRGALEPWHVLGEESTGTGQARYVDSSVERLQIQTFGLVEERYRVLCNGFEVPLQPTSRNGEYVAGVRYRAWQPPSCLHPTIGVHHPLHIDLYDLWNGRSVAGCTYHVVHPGGRANETRPVNAAAAESRRLARFETRGHLGGSLEPVRVEAHPHFPYTLDLRRAYSRRSTRTSISSVS